MSRKQWKNSGDAYNLLVQLKQKNYQSSVLTIFAITVLMIQARRVELWRASSHSKPKLYRSHYYQSNSLSIAMPFLDKHEGPHENAQ